MIVQHCRLWQRLTVSHVGAIPNFVDVSKDTLVCCVKVAELSKTAEKTPLGRRNKHTKRKVSAIVPMHTFGNAVEINKICEIGLEFGIPIVEDAAEALGSFFENQHLGTFGQVGVLSFNGNKTITTGGGGALLFKNTDLGAYAKHLTTTAKVPHPWIFFMTSGLELSNAKYQRSFGLRSIGSDRRKAQEKKNSSSKIPRGI